MGYEIVSFPHKHIVGLCARTANSAPDMMEKIGGIWQRLYTGVLQSIPGRVGKATYGLYTNYETDEDGAYDVIAGCEAQPAPAAEGLVEKDIPAGKYAKFSYTVDITDKAAMGRHWNEIWSTPLNRAYTVDFEEYPPNESKETVPINIYIALKD